MQAPYRRSASGEGERGIKVDQTIAVTSPPSVVLSAIKRYCKVRDNQLDIEIPLSEVTSSGTLALEQCVSVECDPRPNPAIVARYDDRLVIKWRSGGDFPATFEGRITVRPLGVNTELNLKGVYQPGGSEEAQLGVGEAGVQAMALKLLGDFKVAIELQFVAFKDFHKRVESDRERAAKGFGGPPPQAGARSPTPLTRALEAAAMPSSPDSTPSPSRFVAAAF